MVKNLLIEKTELYAHIGIASMRQFQCIPSPYVTENKEENYLEIYLDQVSCPLSRPLKHHKLPISIKIPVTLLQICLYLHDSYLTKFDFMNCVFAHLLVAWL